MGIAIVCKRKHCENYSNCAQYSFQSVDDHQVCGEDDLHQEVEEDDSEENHHTQQVVVSTVTRVRILKRFFLVFVELVTEDELQG